MVDHTSGLCFRWAKAIQYQTKRQTNLAPRSIAFCICLTFVRCGLGEMFLDNIM